MSSFLLVFSLFFALCSSTDSDKGSLLHFFSASERGEERKERGTNERTAGRAKERTNERANEQVIARANERASERGKRWEEAEGREGKR